MHSTDARVAVLSVAVVALIGGATIWAFRTGPRVVTPPPAAEGMPYRDHLKVIGFSQFGRDGEIPFVEWPDWEWLARAPDAAALQAGLRDPDANVRQGAVLVLLRCWEIDPGFIAVIPRDELDALAHDPDPGVRLLAERAKMGTPAP
jgi:hypothetical protein